MNYRKWNRWIAVAVCLLAIAVLFPVLGHTAEADMYSGTCGDNLMWTFDTNTGELTISGSGDMESNPSFREYCSQIQSVSIGNNVTSIGSCAFYDCYNLTSIVIPGSVTSIGSSAFSNSGLTSITIPSNVVSIGIYAFDYCKSLTRIAVASGNSAYCSVSGVLFSYDKKTLVRFPAGKTNSSYTIPNGVQTIDYGAFDSCGNLTSITIPNSVTNIKSWAFNACSSLTTVNYKGTEEQKQSINIDETQNYNLLDAYWCYLPYITAQPTNKKVAIGKTVTIKVAASGSGTLNYQWYYRASETGKWTASSASSAKTAKLTFTAKASHNGYQYRCRIKNTFGTVYTDPITLKTGKAPSITTQPTSKTVKVGNKATFSVVARGSSTLKYQWYYRTSSKGTWKACSASSAKRATYSFTSKASQNGYQFRCKVKNAFGYVYSRIVSLKTGSKPTIITPPTDKNVAIGKTVTFTVKASGSGTLNYQWYYRTSSTGAWTVSSAASAKTASLSFTAKASHKGYQYRCRIKNAFGSVYTSAVTLNTGNKPTIKTQPGQVVRGTITQNVSLKVTASGSGTLSYQWQYRTSSSGTWTAVSASSGKKATYTFKVEERHNGYQYRCRVKNVFGSVYSKTITLKAGSAPTLKWTGSVRTPVNRVVTLTVTASGSGTMRYQWQYLAPGGSWTAVASGGNASKYSFTATAELDGYQYRCLVTNEYGWDKTKPIPLTITDN